MAFCLDAKSLWRVGVERKKLFGQAKRRSLAAKETACYQDEVHPELRGSSSKKRPPLRNSFQYRKLRAP